VLDLDFLFAHGVNGLGPDILAQADLLVTPSRFEDDCFLTTDGTEWAPQWLMAAAQCGRTAQLLGRNQGRSSCYVFATDLSAPPLLRSRSLFV